MRTSGLPNFRKLWGRIEKTLEKGNYTMKIKNCQLFIINIKSNLL